LPALFASKIPSDCAEKGD